MASLALYLPSMTVESLPRMPQPRKTAVEPTLVPQARGGALLSGGKPGNRGGGRPKDALRAALLAGAASALTRLFEIAAASPSHPEAIRATGLLLRHGLRGLQERRVDTADWLVAAPPRALTTEEWLRRR